MDRIDRTAATPYYQQLADILLRQINEGRYVPDDRLPSESELCREFDLSRSTVRETLRSLQDQRIIKMVPRRGAFVAKGIDRGWMLQVTSGFFDYEAHQGGKRVATSVIRAAFEQSSPSVADLLELEGQPTIFSLERVRALDDVPVLRSINYMPAAVGEALIGKPVLQGKDSLNRTLRALGYSISSARREVEAVTVPDEIAESLRLAPGSPVLLIRSISRDENGVPFDFYRSYVRSDLVTIAVDARALEDG
ncbi:GntR family transcriptional regulator [Consotaella salsifontis]|uniref:GntR family transcriptional regulator n=1 Tax=Consotaella salsifontis TaxID=1365950 RepID=A0A1T4SG87_9HYPH|nr:GntR family transcriptional regulator [Consotaella salsifontis]SKA23382.1 GntR family transcriptional regulator [Consotaella salsifontis]SKA27314.1 GntR family transcriptional regulator [Consotaella salsifontis]